MTNKKHLLKIVEGMVEESFSDGKMIENKIAKSIKILKVLSPADAIFAMSEYLKGLKREERAHTMYLETSFAPSPSQVSKARKIIGKQILITKVKISINPEILGGFKLKVGDEVWDETVLSKINQVKEVISHGRSN